MDDTLKGAIEKLKVVKEKPQAFKTKKEAICYLVKETNLNEEECQVAYDFLKELDLSYIKCR